MKEKEASLFLCRVERPSGPGSVNKACLMITGLNPGDVGYPELPLCVATARAGLSCLSLGDRTKAGPCRGRANRTCSSLSALRACAKQALRLPSQDLNPLNGVFRKLHGCWPGGSPDPSALPQG